MPAVESATPPRVSIVIAVLNEAENIAPVCAELIPALASLHPFEVIFVDDGSSDATAAAIARAQAQHPEIRLLRHDRCCGKTAALRTGITAARAPWIATMDGDGQNIPADLVRMLELGLAAGSPAPLVAGIRTRRHDGWSRLVATRIANGFRRAVLGDECPDTGCGMKAFAREDFLRLPAFEGMHRFLPALFQLYGRRLVCCPVGHRARMAGRSKYTNLGRALVGLADTAGVIWLRARTRVPARVAEE
ncbi:Glycosyltransferase family 2 protein [Rhodovastum atsumiense]|uniref:Glycosyltransferase family 2 protein n=1 Tax=Rhodovastum atsumiense TaxID=504468 RepID=A0A5M6IKY1_9PROT|nr:glycosyltransferase family 2 protein [Rhodovastum atsumiense]KAA5608926.1 glycosyltransferase family 2 protein [Rhodovastum atsumiense]CAH2604221.1 Glycosyltransferase family 2 protein [Rhodovastum atsumiense]